MLFLYGGFGARSMGVDFFSRLSIPLAERMSAILVYMGCVDLVIWARDFRD